MFTPLVLTIFTLVPPLPTAPTHDCQLTCPGDPEVQVRALAEFEKAVNEYALLHRRLERAWPPVSFMADLEQLEWAAEQLRAAIRAARPQAAQGNVFTAQVADIFRDRVGTAIGDRHRRSATMMPDEGLANGWRPGVYDSLPWGTASATRPDFSMLPPLPPELEYRIIGLDLILLDVHANLVVDTLDLAGPATAASPEEERIESVGEEFIGCLN